MIYRPLLGADDDVGAWVYARVPNPHPWIAGSGAAIGFTRSETLVAGVTYSQYNGSNVWMAIASEDAGWMNRTNLRTIFHYPFSQLKVKRITALIDASNTRSQRFVERLGLSREATLVSSAPDGDQFVYRLFAEDCRWLENSREQRWETSQGTRLRRSGSRAGSSKH